MSVDIYLLKLKNGYVVDMYWLGGNGVNDKIHDAMVTRVSESEASTIYKLLKPDSLIKIVNECYTYDESFCYAGGLENSELIEVLSDKEAEYQLVVW